MNKVITINLGGNAYQLEEGGYDALRAYLESAAARLEDNPDREEIITDIERAIADKFRALLASHKTVVEGREVAAVLAEMGPIEADGGSAGPDTAAGKGWTSTAGASGPGPIQPEPPGAGAPGGGARRLYRIREGEMIAGVCNGLAAYANLDPTLVRLAFVLVTMLFGSGVIVYIVMMIVVPEAVTPEEKAAASGAPSTAQEFIRRAKEGYYEAMRGFPDRHAYREWQRRFKREMRENARQWGRQWRHGWRRQWWGGWEPPVPTPPMAPVHPGMGFLLPLFSVLHGVLMLLWLCILVSLLATGTLLGLALPATVPVWAGAVVLCIAYGMLVWPLKAARRACYWGLGQPGWAWPFVFFGEAMVWLAMVLVLLWLAIHHLPELRNAIEGFPAQAHQAVSDVKTWWHSK